jgi:hypothetical protein
MYLITEFLLSLHCLSLRECNSKVDSDLGKFWERHIPQNLDSTDSDSARDIVGGKPTYCAAKDPPLSCK